MGNAGNKAAEFAETVKEDASHFIQKLVGDANTFAGLSELFTIQPQKPIPISKPALPFGHLNIKKLLFLGEDLRQAAEQAYPGFDSEAINIAVLGGPGTGKVSLINALLQQPRSAAVPLAGDDEAKVAAQFAEPTFGHIRFWYLPDDYGEEDIPSPDYFFER